MRCWICDGPDVTTNRVVAGVCSMCAEDLRLQRVPRPPSGASFAELVAWSKQYEVPIFRDGALVRVD